MRLVSIDTTLFDKYKNDPEVLTKSKRPYVLVLRLKYKGKNCDFAVPIRPTFLPQHLRISILPYLPDLPHVLKTDMVCTT